MLDRKRLAFGAIYGALLVAFALSGIEFLASFYVPAWPTRALRSVSTFNLATPTTQPASEQDLNTVPFNSWGMKDMEHSLARPANGAPRVVFYWRQFRRSGVPAIVAACCRPAPGRSGRSQD